MAACLPINNMWNWLLFSFTLTQTSVLASSLPALCAVLEAPLEPIAEALNIAEPVLLEELVAQLLTGQKSQFLRTVPRQSGNVPNTLITKRFRATPLPSGRGDRALHSIPSPRGTLLSTFDFKRCALSILTMSIPNIAKTVWDTLIQAHSDWQQAKEQTSNEDELLRYSFLAGVAQQIAIEKVLSMLIIMHSPQAHPCDRMFALYSLNLVTLIGTPGKILHDFMIRINGDYFTKEGFMIEYNPKIYKNSKLLIRLIKQLYPTKTQTTILFKEARAAKIDVYPEDDEPSITNKLISYASDYGKHFGFNKGVEPATIFARRSNRRFLRLMYYCANHAFAEAASIIEEHKHKHFTCVCLPYRCMQRYYTDAHRKFFY